MYMSKYLLHVYVYVMINTFLKNRFDWYHEKGFLFDPI